MNKKGITLMELLAYLALIGIIVTLLTSTMTLAVKSYDQVNGQGALYTEANFVMSNLIVQANAFNPDYIQSCGDNCIELVKAKEKYIDENLGILQEREIHKTVQIKLVKNDDTAPDHYGYDLYIGNLKLNNSKYKFKDNYSYLDIVSQKQVEQNNINYTCYDTGNLTNTCQKFVLSIRLSLYRNPSTYDKLPKTYEFDNKFSF